MPKRLKEELYDVLKRRAEEEGIPDFVDKIADETIGVTEEEVMNHCMKVGHPALEMEPML
jgi:acetyl-CoA synthase